MEQPEAASILSFNLSVSHLLNAAEDSIMLNISEECEEYGIIFKDRDKWWARKEINGERNQNRIEEEGRELEIEGVWWRVKEHLGEIKEGTI